MIYNLAQLIEKSAVVFPEKEAFRCLDDFLTYADLDLKTNQLAAYLISQGLCKGDRVAIYMNRCLETCVAVHGILKAGGAFVAINPFLPHERTRTIIQDCGIEYLISTPAQMNKIKGLIEQLPFLKSIVGIAQIAGAQTITWEDVYHSDHQKYSPPEILGKDLASILYTSGSTGTPKGIMHTHNNVLSLARLEVNLHNATHTDRIGNFAPLHFDQSLFGYFAGPLTGATTVIFPDAYVKLPKSLAALVAKEKITLWFSVPLILTQVLLYGDLDQHDFSALRWVRFGGEVFPVKQLRELMRKWPHAKFINSYGPSELFRCTYYILEDPPETDDPIPLGTVWENTEYKILDENNQQVKPGCPGELVVRTDTLMVGYWNNPELTERALYKEQVVPGYEYVFYRTGDLVKENSNKQLMFLGRLDRQIKLRGYRIELDEIEATLLKYDGVEEAAVIVIRNEAGDSEIEAVVRLLKTVEVSAKDLINYCRKILPPYAVPDHLTIIEEFPRTGSGKIDRKEIIKLFETKVL